MHSPDAENRGACRIRPDPLPAQLGMSRMNSRPRPDDNPRWVVLSGALALRGFRAQLTAHSVSGRNQITAPDRCDGRDSSPPLAFPPWADQSGTTFQVRAPQPVPGLTRRSRADINRPASSGVYCPQQGWSHLQPTLETTSGSEQIATNLFALPHPRLHILSRSLTAINRYLAGCAVITPGRAVRTTPM
jgi:hypothetical protein